VCGKAVARIRIDALVNENKGFKLQRYYIFIEIICVG